MKTNPQAPPPPRPMRGVTMRGGVLRLIRTPGGGTYANPARPLTLRQ